MGTKNRIGVVLKKFGINSMKLWLDISSLGRLISLKSKKNINVISMVGNVVIIMYLIWSNKLDSVTAAARLVVSLSGDILSPKYAPDITAPATIPVSKPKTFPIPINAIPTVAEVDQLLPVAKDVKAHITMQDGRKKDALIILNP